MTNKRWIIHKISDNGLGVFDLVDTQKNESIPFDAKYEACETAIDILNRLSEENKQLKETKDYYHEKYLTMKTERNQLLEENEELKEKLFGVGKWEL